MEFLGILIDTDKGELRLPEQKLARLRRMVVRWEHKLVCTKRDLQSLVGHLQHAATVVRPGRTFVRRMIDLSCVPSAPHHRVRLNKGFRSDLRWWALFLTEWNGVGLFPSRLQSESVYSDASGSWGCGAFWGVQWFQLSWPQQWQAKSIAVKELLPIVVAAALWGRQWSGRRVMFFCDNMAVVAVVKSGSAKDGGLMHLLRCLHFYAAEAGFEFSATHIEGRRNFAADALSRNKVSEFFSFVPQAHRAMSPLPPQLLYLLLTAQLDWMSPRWKELFSSTLNRA